MFPIAAMYYFGHPDFYNHYVRHVRIPPLSYGWWKLNFWPKAEEQPRIPHERSEIKEEVARLRQDRLKRRDERLQRENVTPEKPQWERRLYSELKLYGNTERGQMAWKDKKRVCIWEKWLFDSVFGMDPLNCGRQSAQLPRSTVVRTFPATKIL